MPQDTLTVMAACDGRPAAKRLLPNGKSEPADPKATWFRGDEHVIDSLDALAQALDLLAVNPAVFLVRGTIIAGVDRDRMRRAHVNGPTLTELARHWVLLDVDKYREDVSPSDFVADLAGWAGLVREALPAEFRPAACWYQATGSAGVKPGIRLRLAFWCARPVGDEEWEARLPGWIDKSLFTPSQPHYIAAPILDGIPDPVLGPRSGMLPGEPEVILGPLTLAAPEKKTSATDALKKAVRAIKGALEGTRRNTLNKEAYRLALTREDLEPKTIVETLFLAAQSAGFGDDQAYTTLTQAAQDGRSKAAQEQEGWKSELVRDENGNPRTTAANVSLYLSHHSAFSGLSALRGIVPVWRETTALGAIGPVKDADCTGIVEWFQRETAIQASAAWVQAGINKAAAQRPFDPVQEYLDSRRGDWDGQARVDTFFCRHWGVEDTELTRAQTRIWFSQAARRPFATMDEPVKADYMIVLTGAQGQRKSMGLEALCPHASWFLDELPDIRDKDSKMALLDAWIVELAEFTHRKSDTDAFKAFLTRTVDKFRPPYGKAVVQAPRRCVLIATLNSTIFLSDTTGNRRFWTLEVLTRAEPEAIRAERDQLWSEALEIHEQAWLPDALEQDSAQKQEHFTDRSNTESLEEQLALVLGRSLAPQHTALDFGWQAGDLNPGRHVLRLTATQACGLLNLDRHNSRNLHRIKETLKQMLWRESRSQHGTRRYWVPPQGWQYKNEGAHVFS